MMTSSVAASTLSQRRRQREESGEPASLVRPKLSAETTEAIFALLNRPNLTDDEIRDFLEGRSALVQSDGNSSEFLKLRKAFQNRRSQTREWAAQVESGATQMDEHNRLVPTPRPEPPEIPPVVPPAAPLLNNNNNNNNNNADNEEEERRWMEQEEREAAETIARAVRRYRQEGVPEEDFFLVRIPPREQNAANLTFRRICFAVLAVATAFVCIMLQTLPLMQTSTPVNPTFDNLMQEILHVREFDAHARHCKGLHRETTRTWWRDWRSSKVDCADGVLHIPATHVIAHSTKIQKNADPLPSYTNQGVNVSWFMPCHAPAYGENISACFPGAANNETDRETCRPHACFRGVHDGLVSWSEVEDVLRLGGRLIQEGADHFDIHDDVTILEPWIPGILVKIKDLLVTRYGAAVDLTPVAFRVSIALPMDGSGVPLYGSKAPNLLVLNINRTNYLDWLEKCARQNDLAAYSLPPPFETKPVRDTCHLMADLEADPRFAVHSSVFLSTAAGKDYTGGAALYVDDHPSNENRRRKVQRGVSVDGSLGRIVVSSGGLENRRCRLPTRSGVRAALQIWWGCKNEKTTSACS